MDKERKGGVSRQSSVRQRTASAKSNKGSLKSQGSNSSQRRIKPYTENGKDSLGGRLVGHEGFGFQNFVIGGERELKNIAGSPSAKSGHLFAYGSGTDPNHKLSGSGSNNFLPGVDCQHYSIHDDRHGSPSEASAQEEQWVDEADVVGGARPYIGFRNGSGVQSAGRQGNRSYV